MKGRILAAAVAAMLLASVSVAPAIAGTRAPSAAAATTVTVTMTEFKFAFSKASVKKGKVTFKLVNKGSLPHDLKIAGKKSKLIQPGKTGTLVVTFKKAGKYAYLCTVPGHAAAGMKGKLKVT